MKRPRRTLPLALALAALGLLALAASAGAATVTTKCSGNAPQNKAQEYETASCAVRPGEKRKIEGIVRNDKNKPVAAQLKVTFSKWIPAGNSSYDVTPEKTIEIKAGANGKFTIPTTTSTEETVFIEAIGDPDLELSTVAAEVNVQRLVTATAKKLGGGKVQVTVKGASSPVKVGITEEGGYFVSGGAARKANKAGVATFDLGSQRGTFGIYVDAGELGDLYYVEAKPLKL
jgi:hypothetical protein